MEAEPLIVIVGPTASGKTAFAIRLAQKINGEIICADSRTVYTGMDIGTAKPTKQERQLVPHWGLDIVEPNIRFSAANFQTYALKTIADIRNRGKTPILVGGTGLYVDAIIFDYQFGSAPDEYLRQQLNGMNLEELIQYCIKNNIQLPENDKNKRYVIRAIEQKSINSKRSDKPNDNTIIVGITTDREELRKRIAQRTEQLFEDNVIEEARQLSSKYGWSHESMTGNIYPLCRQYIDGTISLDELKQRFIMLDMRLAKRQMTWLKRNTYIHWALLADAEDYVLTELASEH